MEENIQPGWACRALRSPLGGLHGAVVEADDDVLGVAWDEDLRSAAVRAVGEAVERSALHSPTGTGSLELGTASELGERAADLTDCVRFSPAQLERSDALEEWRWTERTPTTWTEVQRDDATTTLLPIDLVQMLRIDRVRIRCASSIGTACGRTWDDALSRALLEAVERHAVAESVYLDRRALRTTSDDPATQRISTRLSASGLRLGTGLLANDCRVPVAIAIIQGDGQETPAAVFGSAGGRTAAEALHGAALEAVHTFHLGWRLMRRGDPVRDVPEGINDRVLWWASNGGDLAPGYLTNEHVPLHNAELALELPSGPIGGAEIGQSLVDANCRWFSSDITPAWAVGVRVARAVAPALLQLRLDEAHPYLCAPRWPEAVAKLTTTHAGGLAPPHPYV